MWLTLLWNNKGLVALGVLLVAFVGLGTALKVQSARLEAQQKLTLEERNAKEAAIEAHDQLVADWERQKRVLDEREALRQQQEVENAKLHQTIRKILQGHQAWATAALPADIVGVLQTLPKDSVGTSAAPSEPNTSSILLRADKRRPSLLGDLGERFRHYLQPR